MVVVPPERGGDRAGVEIVCAENPARRHLLDVAMAVDSAGQHELARCVDLVLAFAEVMRKSDDPAVADPNVGGERVGGARDGAAANDEIESVHLESPGHVKK